MSSWEEKRLARFALWPEKSCAHCNQKLVPKRFNNGVWESLPGFKRRRFCGEECSTASQTGKIKNDWTGVDTFVCPRCLELKPVDQFPLKGITKKGKPRYSYCKNCHSDYQRINSLKVKFSLTLEDVDKILSFQNNGCAICGRPSSGKVRLSVDHDHQSGLIRGILCWVCNRTLGMFKDDADRFQKLVNYLLLPPATAALGAPRYGLPGRTGTKKQRQLLKKLQKQQITNLNWRKSQEAVEEQNG